MHRCFTSVELLLMAWKNFLLNRFRKNAKTFTKSKSTSPHKSPKAPLYCEPLESRELLTVYTPGDLIVLQAGNGNAFNSQAPLFLNEYTTTAAAAMVQQAGIPNSLAVGGATNQPITLDLTAAAGNGQLNRSYDGSVLTFGGVDSGVNNGNFISPQTPTGSADRVTAITGNNLNNITAASWSSGTVTITTQNAHGYSNGQTVTITGMTPNGYNGTFTIATTAQNNQFTYSLASNPGTATTFGLAANSYDTTTHGQYYVGDDNRGAVVESPTGPIYAVGHPNQAGAAVSQGVLYFGSPGPALGTQVSFQANIRGATIGFDNRLYYSTAGSTTAGLAGVYTESVALPSLANANPASDVPVVKALFSASKLGGVFLADVNGDGIVDNGDRIYFNDDGTVGGAGTGGVYMSVFDNTRWGGSNAVPGQAPGWSPAIRLGEGIISAQPTPQTTAQLRGLAGTVLYASNSNVQLYATEFDNVAGNNSYLLSFLDNTPGILRIASASESGSTATITTQDTLPSSFTVGASVTVNSVGTGTGTFPTAGGFNGVWTITGVSGNSFTYTDSNASNLATVTGSGVTDLFLSPTIIQTVADGNDGPTHAANAAQALRGVAFAPVAATTVSLVFTPANPVTPGAQVTFTATLSNPQVGAAGLNGNTVTFIDQNTNTVLGQGTISTTGGVTTATFSTSPVLIGNHFVVAYFAGGGTSALPSATSNTVQVVEAGVVTSSTAVTSSLSAAAVGVPVTLTATVTGTLVTTPGGTVSFYNGSVALANLLGTTSLNGSAMASLTTSFPATGAQTVIAVYNGDNTYASSQAQLTVTTTANATATITSSANNVALNATPTYTVTLNGNATLGSPSGGVQFFLQNTFTGVTTPLGGFAISSVTESGSTVTVTTSTATGFSVGQTVTITGVAVGAYNGTVTVASVSGTSFTYTSGTTGLGSSSGGFATPFITLAAGSGNTATASITSPALANPGSYLVTVAYNASGTNNPYASFTVNTSSSANGTAFIETVQEAFTPGDLIAVQRGDGSVNLGSSGYLVFLTEYTTSGTLVQKIAMPDLDAGSTHALLLSGQNGAEGLLNRSANGYFLTLSGYDLPVGRQFVTSTFPYQFPRTIARVDLGANINSSTAISTTAPVSVPYNPLDVVSNDGNEFWLVSNLPTGDVSDSGILFVNSVGATTATQLTAGNTSGAAVAIAGGQLYVTKTSGDVQTVGTGLPTTGSQALAGLPNLASAYASFFPNAEAPEQVLLLNTADGTSNNPNLAYIADQANGLLKFWKDSSGNWQYGRVSDGFFGQKLVGSSGVTGVVGFINNPGTSTASVQLYVTGTPVNGQNPNQLDAFTDANGAPAGTTTTGVDQGFSSGSFTKLVFVGQTGTSPNFNANGNMNFAGLAFAPGFQTSVNLTTTANTASFGTSLTFTATVTASGTGAGTPTGVVTFFDGPTAIGTGTLNSSGVATLTTTTLGSGSHSITAFYNGDVKDGTSTSNGVSETISFVTGDVVVSQVGTGTGSLSGNTATTFINQYTNTGTANGSTPMPTSIVSATVSTIAESGTTATATTSAAHGFAVGESVTITGSSVAGYNKTFTITAVTSTTFTFTATSGLGSATGGTATVTRVLTETGTATGEGYLTDALDGHTLGIAGYNVAAGNSTTGVNRDIAVLAASGATDLTTQLPSGTGNVRVAIAPDGQGFFVATSTGIRYVAFGDNGAASTQVTAEVSSPTAVGIGTLNTSGSGTGTPGQLFGSAGAGAQSNGVPALDSPYTVGTGLPTAGGQGITVSSSFPTARDAFNNFPTTNQFAISPDGNTIFIADSRTDGVGGILEYFQSLANNWTLVGHLQLDSFGISSATESGTTVTITTSQATNFVTGQSVSINGVSVAGYNTTATITVTDSTHFTYTLPSSGLASGSGGSATSADGGLRGLVADFSGSSPVLYATTSATSGNRLVKITGATLDGSTPGLAYTTLATAPANTAFRGVALSPKAAGTTVSTTSLAVTNSPATYGAGVTLTATVTTNATGWVSFRQNGVEIGVAPVVTSGGVSTATFVTAGNLGASSTAYSIVAVYTGDSTFAPSTSSSQSATINQASTSTSLAATSNGQTLTSGASVATGQSVTLVGTVTVPAGTAPTGTITFKNGTTTIGSPATVTQVIVNQSGSAVITFQASISTSFTTQGSASLTAVYSGDSNFSTSTSSAFTLNVVNTTTTTVTTSNTNPTASPSQNVTFTATISSPDTTDTISGSVQFYDDLLPIGSAVTVSGTSGVQVTSSTFATGLLQSGTTLVPGLHSITAIYTPDTAGSAHFGTSSGVYEQNVQGTSFGATDVFAYRVGDGTTNLIAQSPNPSAGAGSIGSTIYIDEFTSSGTAVQSFILPTADSQAFSVSAASESGTTVTLTTAAPHNFAVGDKVTVAGISPAGYSGTFTITAVTSTTIQYTAASGLGTATLTNATATGVVHAAVGNGQQSATEQLSESADGQTLWVAAYDNNPLNVATAAAIPTAGSVPRAVARLSSSGVVQTEGLPSSISSTSNSTSNFNGVFSPDGNQFYVTNGFTIYYYSSFAPVAGLVTATATIGTVPNSTGSLTVNTNALGLENDGGNLAVVGEVYGSPTTASLVGAYTGLPTASTANVTISSLTESGTTVTATTSAANGFATGASVTISGSTVSGYNGTFTVTVLDSTHFTFTAASGLSSDTSGSARATENLLLAGLPSTDNFQLFPIDAYFTHLGGTGAPAGINTFYLSDDGPSFANGRITKWALSSSGTWSLVDTITAQGPSGTGNQAISFYWLAGTTNSSGNVTLDVSYGNGGNSDTGPGFVYSISDTNGWNAPIGTGGSHSDSISTVATVATGSNEVFRGVAFRMNQAPSITSPATATFSFGIAGTFTAKAIGTSSITWSETGTLPTGVTLSSAGVLSGTPTQSGSFPFTLTATNSVGSANQAFTLIVNPGTAPAFTSASSTTFTVGTAGSFTVTASGSPAPTLSESGTDTLPSGVIFTASTGVLSGTPAAGTGGTYTLHFTAHNGVGSDANQTFTLTVGQAPAITSANNTTFTQGSAGTFTATATGFPNPTFSETGVLPFGVTFTSAGVLSGTPTVFGSFPITITASNGVGTAATQSFTLTVTGTSFVILNRPDGSKGVSVTPSGVVLTFTGPIDKSTLDLWNSSVIGGVSSSNITVKNGSTDIRGSLVPDPVNPNIVTFVPTLGKSAMAPGTYTVNVAPSAAPVTITSATFSSGSITIQTSSAPSIAYAVGQVVTIAGMTPSAYNGVFTISSVVNSTTFTFGGGQLSNPGTATTFGTAALTGPQGTNGVTGAGFNGSFSFSDPAPYLSVPEFARGPAQTVQFLNPDGSTAFNGIPVSITGANVTQASFDLVYDPTQLTIASTGAVSLSSIAAAAGMGTPVYSITNIDANHSKLSVSVVGGSGLSSSATITAASYNATNNQVTITTNGTPTSPYAVGQTVIISGMTPTAYNGTYTIAAVGGSSSAPTFSFVLATNPGTATAFGTAQNSEPVVVIAASVPPAAVYGSKAVLDVQNVFVNNAAGTAVAGMDANAYAGDTNGDGKLGAQDSSATQQVANGTVRGYTTSPANLTTQINFKDLDPFVLGDVSPSYQIDGQDASVESQKANGTNTNVIESIPAYAITNAVWSSTSGGQVTVTVQSAPAVGFVVGEKIIVSGIQPSGYNSPANTSFTITSVPSSTQFTYALATNPGTATDFSQASAQVTPTYNGSTANTADPKLFFQNARGFAGETLTMTLSFNNTDSSAISAASWSGGTVTITTSNAVGWQSGETVTISGMTPSGYNGTFSIASVISSTQFTYALATNPGTATAFGTAGGTIALTSLDEAIVFDPNKFTVSNVRTGSLLSNATGWSTSANVNNTTGQIRVTQSTGTATSITPGSSGDVLLFDVTLNSNLSAGATVVANLAASVTSNGSTTFTDANTNAGALTLNPAPVNPASPGQSIDNSDGVITIVGPNGNLQFDNHGVTAGSTVTEHLNFTNDVVPLNVTSLDEGIFFNPAVLQVVSVSTGNGLTSGSATGWSTSANFNNTTGQIRVTQSTGTATAVSAGTVLDVLDITFQVAGTASGQTAINLAASVTSNGSTTFTDVNQNSGSIQLNPAPVNPVTPGVSVDSNDGVITIVVQPNEPPFDALPAPSKIPQVLFNPASVSGLHTATANTVTFSPTGGVGSVSDAITVSDPDTFMTVAAANESGTTVTITTTDANSFTIGETVVIAGITPSGYDGSFTITGTPTSTTFTYTAASGLGSATLSGATAAISVSNPANAIAAVSETGTTVTITTSQPSGFVTGENVIIAGMTPSGYNGTFAITVVDSTHFTYTAAASLGTATAFGTATLAPTETTELKLTGSGSSSGSVGTLTLASTTNLTVTGNNTGDVFVTGALTDINNALNGLKYTPGAGFFGTATLAVTTNDNGNSHFGGPLIDSHSTTVTVVGLFLSEIYLNTTSNLTTPSANQYLEIFSTVPSYTIPSTVYVVGIQGNNSTVTDIFGNSTTNTPGDVTDVFKLGGFVTGSNGYLALLQKGQTYPAADLVTAGTIATNNGTQAGFGNGGGSSSFTFGSTTLTGVHVGQDQNGVGVRLGTNPDLPGDGATAAGELSWDMPQGSSSYLLIQTSTTPAVQTSTVAATNIDGGSTSTSTVAGGTAYSAWNVLDGVAILASPLSPTGGGTYTQNGPDRSYAPLTFQSATNTGTVVSGGNVVTTGTTTSPWTATYVGRISQSTGSSSADWLASVPTGTAPNFVLGTNTSNTNFSGEPLNSIGGPNFWADEMNVVVNDGTSNQHSQVSELTLTFASPVKLTGTADRFQITAATDNGASANTATVTTSSAHDFMVGQTINIIGVTGTGWTGNKVITAITSTTITFARGTITANGTTSASSFAQATGSLSSSFRNIFQVLSTVNITGASWSSTSGGTATITANNNFSAGQTVTVAGITGATGFNGTFTIVTANATSFTYALATQPTGTPGFAGATAGVPVTLLFTIPTGGGTYASATGVATNVTVLVIKFLATGNLTVSFTNADPMGNKVGLNDGDYFLNTTASLVTDSQGHQLDGARTGSFGTNGHDEFWRLYGDANGDRNVDGEDTSFFRNSYNYAQTHTDVDAQALLWFMDYDMNGIMDSNDVGQFNSRFNRHLNP
jgi:hypothetical protein